MCPEAFGIQRFTRRIRERLDQILSDGPFGRIDGFLWSDGANLREVTARRPDGPGDPRDLDEIALPELATTAETILAAEIAMPIDDLVRAVGRWHGRPRFGKRTAERLLLAIDTLIEAGHAHRDENGRVRR